MLHGAEVTGLYPSPMPLNFDLAGKVYPAVRATATPEQIEAYAAASGDDSPHYRIGPDQIAPLIFGVVPGFDALIMGPTTDPDLGVGNPLMIVHGEQEFVYYRPLRPGEPLVLRPTLDRVEDKGSGATFVTKVAITSGDEAVLDLYATIFVRGGGSGTPRSKGLKPSPPARGAAAGSFTSYVTEDMPERYAPASGDHNPIHLDEEVAKAVGLPGRINHGLGTLSLVTGGLIESIAGGDPTVVNGLRVRFTDMVFPGSELVTELWEFDGGYEFETRRPDGATVLAGSLSLRSR